MELKNSATGGTEPRDFILRWGALLLLRRRRCRLCRCSLEQNKNERASSRVGYRSHSICAEQPIFANNL
jgi:hypothetical protein